MQELIEMDQAKELDRKYEMVGWGVLLIWWGLRWSLLASLPSGAGLIGTGLIFLGVAAVRSLNGLHTRSSTRWIGIFALAWGGLELANSLVLLPFKMPVFETLLILLGGVLLLNGLRLGRQTSIGERV
jgi:hypothetical protein